MAQDITIAFMGNPNCGKTTLFNAYTGANLKVANWPGVTVERVEGAKVQIKDRMTMPCTAECTLIKLSNHIMFLYIYSR